jgi:rod shape-determining protein MreC
VYDKQVRRRRAVLALLVVVSLILLTAYFGESPGSPLHAVQRGVIGVLSPVQEGASRALKPVRDLFGWFGDTLHARKQRDEYRKQNEALVKEVAADRAALQQNAALRKLVALDGADGLAAYGLKTARVIGRAPTLWYATVQVNRGSDDGVRLDQAVISGDGLVGRVSEVSSGSAQVTLITDHTSAVSAKVLSSGGAADFGLVVPAVGDPNDLLVRYLANAPIKTGDQVVTAGLRSSKLESLFPPDIPIGRVTQVSQAELQDSQQVHITPNVSLRQLDFVQILTRESPGGGYRAQVP